MHTYKQTYVYGFHKYSHSLFMAGVIFKENAYIHTCKQTYMHIHIHTYIHTYVRT